MSEIWRLPVAGFVAHATMSAGIAASTASDHFNRIHPADLEDPPRMKRVRPSDAESVLDPHRQYTQRVELTSNRLDDLLRRRPEWRAREAPHLTQENNGRR